MPSSSAGESTDAHKAGTREIADWSQARFSDIHKAREQALRLSRDVIRNSANAIRATHRAEYDLARELTGQVEGLIGEIERAVQAHPQVYYAGFVEDAQKEYVEACATLSFAAGSRLAGPEELGVGPAPYMNGLAETVGELRRFILDSLRRDDFSRCEELLDLMNEIYAALVSMDFPEAVTRGLRRNTDAARGILERTRADLTVALRQRRLEQKLAALQEALAGPQSEDSSGA